MVIRQYTPLDLREAQLPDYIPELVRESNRQVADEKSIRKWNQLSTL